MQVPRYEMVHRSSNRCCCRSFCEGCLRHRRIWTRESWRRFAFAFVLSLIPSTAGLILALKLDQGLEFGNTPTLRAVSVIAMGVIAVFTFTVPIHLLGWFATIEPESIRLASYLLGAKRLTHAEADKRSIVCSPRAENI